MLAELTLPATATTATATGRRNRERAQVLCIKIGEKGGKEERREGAREEVQEKKAK